MLNEHDKKFLRIAYNEAKAGFDEGGCPIGSLSYDPLIGFKQARND